MNECIFDIDPKLLSLASEAENECREMFEKIVLKAQQVTDTATWAEIL